ncbi:hypothetical protein [Hyphococcus sp.]|jgi:hypothetical protein|uniref:hypothetical protein n=1 Tax=Hyphococcus sp. TaxID=2038636 RepID=UPI003D0C2854
MKPILAAFAAIAAICFAVPAHADKPAAACPAKAAPYEPMAPFAKLAGRAWRGEGIGPNGQPVVDIAKYEMILGGRAFQSTHKLENGSYGGRTIIFFDEGAKRYIFHYFTTAGFHTTGEIVPTETGFTAVEQVQNHPEFAEVRSEAFYGDKTIRVVSSHVTHDGDASSGEELVYKEIPSKGVLLFDEADALFGKRTDVKDAQDRYGDDDC